MSAAHCWTDFSNQQKTRARLPGFFIKLVPEAGTICLGAESVHTNSTPSAARPAFRAFRCDSLVDAYAYAKGAADADGGEVFRNEDTGSMEPAFDGNVFVVCRPIKSRDIEVGDVLVFRRKSGARVMHRVHRKISKARFEMKGDANDVPDIETVGGFDVIGRVYRAFTFPPESLASR